MAQARSTAQLEANCTVPQSQEEDDAATFGGRHLAVASSMITPVFQGLRLCVLRERSWVLAKGLGQLGVVSSAKR